MASTQVKKRSHSVNIDRHRVRAVVVVFVANLVAFLAVTETSLPFRTLQEMTSQSEYKYGVEDGIVQMMLFQVPVIGA